MSTDPSNTYNRIRVALLDGADLHHLNLTVREVDVLAAMVDLAVNRVGEAREPGLHGREAEVLAGMARGRSNAEIGREMRLNESTVRKYATTVLRKLGVRNRAQAVITGLVTGDLELAELAEAVAHDNLAAERAGATAA